MTTTAGIHPRIRRGIFGLRLEKGRGGFIWRIYLFIKITENDTWRLVRDGFGFKVCGNRGLSDVDARHTVQYMYL